MGYLGIDTVGSRRLATRLTKIHRAIDGARALIVQAEILADLDVGVAGRLDEVDRSFRSIATTVIRAADEAEGFVLPVSRSGPFFPAPGPKPTPRRAEPMPLGVDSAAPAPLPVPPPTPSPIPTPPSRIPGVSGNAPLGPAGSMSPRWDAEPTTPWNLVHQEASHNSYGVDGGIATLYQHGVRSFELDIHRGAPTDFWPGPLMSPVPLPVSIWLDARSHGGGRSDDWRVYHHSLDTDSEYEYFTDGLRAIVELESDEAITLFVDNKDGFDDTHTPQQLNRLLEAELGAALFTPQDLLARAPGASTLREAVERAGWPSAGELEGRVLVVLTDDVVGYEIDGASAFVGVNPGFSSAPSGAPVLVPTPNAVYYNDRAAAVDELEITALQSGGSLLRVYDATVDRCAEPVAAAPNFVAVDHTFPEPAARCGEPVRVQPAPTPVPTP